jgi:sulfur-oxidizing protein SoxZ
MALSRISMPAAAKKGDVIEIRSLVQHHMETGYRRDNDGRPIVRDIINRFVVTYNEAEIFRSELGPGIAANPFFAFSTVAVETGDVVFTWTDEKGEVTSVTKKLTVT